MSHITPSEAFPTFSEGFLLTYETDSDNSTNASNCCDDFSEAGYETDLTEPNDWHTPGVGFNPDLDFGDLTDGDDLDDDHNDGVDLSDPVEIFADSLAAFNFDGDFLLYDDMHWNLWRDVQQHDHPCLWKDNEWESTIPFMNFEWMQELLERTSRHLERYEEGVAELDEIASRAHAAGNHELTAWIAAAPRTIGEFYRTLAHLRGRISGLSEYIADLQQGNDIASDLRVNYRKALHWVPREEEDPNDHPYWVNPDFPLLAVHESG